VFSFSRIIRLWLQRETSTIAVRNGDQLKGRCTLRVAPSLCAGLISINIKARMRRAGAYRHNHHHADTKQPLNAEA
jgi:hypothetical protein